MKINMIVSLMAAGARKRFSREEYRRIREEANALFQKLTEENRDIPKAMKKHTGTNIFPAIAVYKNKNLKWARKSTIGHGAPCCDFRIIDVSRRPDYDG